MIGITVVMVIAELCVPPTALLSVVRSSFHSRTRRATGTGRGFTAVKIKLST